jgi:hypothetical protein
MRLDTFNQCLSKIPPGVSIHFLGMAEPWLNPDCTKMLMRSHEAGYRISVSTTLVGMRPSDIKMFKSIPFDMFILHLPSDDSAMNLKVDGAYLNLLVKICNAELQNLRQKRFGNLHPEIEPIVKGVKEIQWPTMNRSNNLTGAHIPVTKKVKGNIKCHRIRNNVLLPNGEVALCCNDYGLRHIIGNLLTGSYDALFKGDEFRKVRSGMKDNASEILCRYCSEPCMKVT